MVWVGLGTYEALWESSESQGEVETVGFKFFTHFVFMILFAVVVIVVFRKSFCGTISLFVPERFPIRCNDSPF